MKKHLILAGTVALALAGARAVFANAVFPIGNYVVMGAALDWGGRDITASSYFDASDSVTVMATRRDGTVVAKAAVSDRYEIAGDAWVNFRLDVPMASGYTESMVTNGEYLTILVVTDTATYTTAFSDAVRVTGAGESTRLDFRLADDADCDGVADEYVAELASDMEANYYDRYDPEADWDGDGQSNWDEYRAGTDPFDPNDVFHVSAAASHKGGFTGSGGQTFPIQFEAKNGRTYFAVGTGQLSVNVTNTYQYIEVSPGVTNVVTNATVMAEEAFMTITNVAHETFWTNETFTVENDEVGEENIVRGYYTLRSADAMNTTFWMLPIGNQHFWKVLIKADESSVPIKRIQ